MDETRKRLERKFKRVTRNRKCLIGSVRAKACQRVVKAKSVATKVKETMAHNSMALLEKIEQKLEQARLRREQLMEAKRQHQF